MTKKSKSLVLITGSSSGIGLCAVERFLDKGYRVIATCQNKAAIRKNIRADLLSSPDLTLEDLDVSNEQAWTDLLDRLDLKKNSVDILINNAGVLYPNFLVDSSWSEVQAHFQVNTLGVVLGCHKLAPLMVAQGFGHIINIGSLSALAPVPGIAAYSASKFAVRGFSLALAMELRPSQVFVSVIEPDVCATPMLQKVESNRAAGHLFAKTKLLHASDVVDAVFDTVLTKRPSELILPNYRGYLAKFMTMWPELAMKIEPSFRRRGLSKQAQHILQPH